MAKVRRVQQLSVFLEDRPGQLALLCSCLAEAGVNIEGMTVADTVEHGIVRCIADQPDKACRALEENGFNCLRAELLEAEIPNQIGGLAAFTDRLAAAGVNVQYCYGCRRQDGDHGILYIRTPDLDEAEAALLG